MRHSSVHLSLSKVIFPYPQSILGLWFLNQGITRITSWFGRLATSKEIVSLWLPMAIGTVALWVTGPIALISPSASKISFGVFFLEVLSPYLSQNPLSIKSSVAPESIIALIVTSR